ncbi:CPBP family intramembrane glutamic endopeptidase [Brochothrix thermosphacta]
MLVPIIKVYYLLTTINEELYFRYNFLYSNHKRKLTSLFLLILSSILFGMAHYFVTNSLIGTFPYIIGGLFLGLIYLKTKNIYYVIGIHFFNNLIYGILQ